MKRKGGLLRVLLAVALAVLLVGVVVTVLALHSNIRIGEITPKKTAGKVLELGEFNASMLEVREIVGNVSVVTANVSGVVVKSNLPINFTLENDLLIVYCPTKRVGLSHRNVCNDYRNGTVIVEVSGELLGLTVRDTVGNVFVAADSVGIEIANIVGTVNGTTWGDYDVSNIVGRVSINVKGRATVDNVVGDVKINVPKDYTALLTSKDVLGEVRNNATGKNGTVLIAVENIVGDVEVEG